MIRPAESAAVRGGGVWCVLVQDHKQNRNSERFSSTLFGRFHCIKFDGEEATNK